MKSGLLKPKPMTEKRKKQIKECKLDYKIHIILNEFIVDLCENQTNGHVCNPPDKIYKKTYRKLKKLTKSK